MEVCFANTENDLRRIAPVLCQLRPAYQPQALVAQIQEQQRESGYQVAYVAEEGRVLSVAGFVVNLKLAWGRHLYVDDLVTDAEARSSGAGKVMLEWLKGYAREQGCEQMHLDSGVQRFRAHRFYLRQGFDINSHHFALNDLTI